MALELRLRISGRSINNRVMTDMMMPPMAMLLYLDFNPRMPRTILVTPLGQKRRLQPGSHAAQNPKRLKASDAAAIPLLSLVEAAPGAGGRGLNCSDITVSL
jgi:hypothetical protein